MLNNVLQNGIRPSWYNYTGYAADFELYQSAFKAAGVPFPKVQGAVFCCSQPSFDAALPSYVQQFAKNVLVSLSYHQYPLNVCNGNTASLAQLMNDSSSAGVASRVAGWAAATASAGIPFRIGEGNSVACGGAYGVSDTFGAALWAMDVMFNVATVGVSRWNFHGGPGGAYSPIWYNDTAVDIPYVMPLYYGMWAFTVATAHNAIIMASKITTTNGQIKAWSVQDGTGAWRVTLLHKDLYATAPAAVTVVPQAALTQPAVLVRMAPSSGQMTATSGISFGGITFDGSQDGLPLGQAVNETVAANAAGSYTFTLNPASAAILYLPLA